jgi:hypothetical protein
MAHKEKVLAALEASPEGLTFSQMRQATQLGARDVGRACDRLEADGTVETAVLPALGPEFPVWRLKKSKPKRKGGSTAENQPG